MNNTIRLDKFPERIVSLVPSQTELLFDLNCGDTVVGITKFCIHPDEWFRSKTRVGGTKNVKFEKIAELQPDLIIANKEENSKEDIEELQKHYQVYVSDIYTIDDACEMIRDVGKLLNKEKETAEMVQRVKKDFAALPSLEGTVLYFIWRDPYMVVGPNTFIGHVIERLGLKNVIRQKDERYVMMTPEQIVALNPDHLLLSSEPFPFSDKHSTELKKFYKGQVHLVDGELFSWYGSRMLKMKAYFDDLRINFNKE